MGKWSLVLTFAFVAVACADDPQRPPIESDVPVQPGTGKIGGGGGTRNDAGLADAAADAAGVCTDLVASGSTVDQTAISDDLVAGSGGTLLDGIYDITEARVFVGSAGVPGLTGTTYRGAIRIAAAAFERALVVRSAGGATADTQGKGTFTPNGVNATMLLSCPISVQEQVTYSVLNSGNTLTISNLITKESLTYAKRP